MFALMKFLLDSICIFIYKISFRNDNHLKQSAFLMYNLIGFGQSGFEFSIPFFRSEMSKLLIHDCNLIDLPRGVDFLNSNQTEF